MVTEARITCPNGGFSKVEPMPTDACRHLYECGAFLRPLTGDRYVFCSYADHACPPKQAAA